MKNGGIPVIINLLRYGSQQIVALAVQTLWVLLLERKNHEVVVSLGGMQILIDKVKQSNVVEAVKDLAAQALYSLWSEEGTNLFLNFLHCNIY